jgi:hypothetical protein
MKNMYKYQLNIPIQINIPMNQNSNVAILSEKVAFQLTVDELEEEEELVEAIKSEIRRMGTFLGFLIF